MFSRRSYLATVTAAVAGVAGCSSSDSGGSGGDGQQATSTTTTAGTPTPSPTATKTPPTPTPSPTATETPATPTPSPTATETPATPTPSPTATETPVPTAAPGELPTKAQLRAQYTRFTDVTRSSAEAELVGSDIRADIDIDTADLTLLATQFAGGKSATEDNTYHRVDRSGVTIPAEGERRRLSFTVSLPEDSYEIGNVQYFLYIRAPGAALSEAIQLCESDNYDARQGNFSPNPGPGLLAAVEDRSEENYRRYATEGYLLTAVKATTLDGREFVFEYPVFLSTYQSNILREEFELRGAHQYNTQLTGYRRALQQAAGGDDARSLLLTGIAVNRSLPDIPQTRVRQEGARTVERVLVEGGPTKAGVSVAMTAAAQFAGYDVAVLASTGTVGPGIAGDFSGLSVDAGGTSYYYVEPAARSDIGEAPNTLQQDNLYAILL